MNLAKLFILFLLLTFRFLSASQVSKTDKVSDTLSWNDKEGSKRIVVNIITQGVPGTKQWDNRISAKFFTLEKDSAYEINGVKESAAEMDRILFSKSDINLSDLDKDSIVEAYLFYEILKDGLDDNILKLVYFYKETKIVVRGNIPKMSERRSKLACLIKNDHFLSDKVRSILIQNWKKEARKRMEHYISKLE